MSELRRLNPKNEKGNRKGKHTQWIDIDYGHPKLKEHLNILIAFGRASGYNMNNWKRMVERALPNLSLKRKKRRSKKLRFTLSFVLYQFMVKLVYSYHLQ